MPIVSGGGGGGSGSGVTVGTTLPASPANGATVLLRVGSSPFTEVLLTFDSTLNKWVSAPVCVMQQTPADLTPLGSPGAYTVLGSASAIVPHTVILPDFKALWDVNVRPQVRIFSWFNAGVGGNVVSFQAQLSYMNNSDAAAAWQSNQMQSPDPTITVTGTTDATTVSGWSDFTGTATTTKANAVIQLAEKSSAASGAIRATAVWFRWSST